ncbi:hypothetical protein [Thalassotalea sp. PP2-459]|uniref:hypothetical protein n=1 Tax=Thalassotalea sp. PP2-459 TaxID=1742724 RepID=UPI000943C23E|nr:hypothetical protein [Thalassotalea sp. PP2-459]OKY25034.1 hypothetical protein BI291_17370 [Thalassotalea sp. PP2-459]
MGKWTIEPDYYENFAERKNLYAKIARGERAPSKNIRKLFPELESTWKSPIWEALELGGEPKDTFVEFYQSLPIKFQKIVFSKDSSPKNGFKIGVSQPQIKAIQNFCCENALACLIALNAQPKEMCIACGGNLEIPLNNSLLDHFAVSPINYFNQEILEYVFEKLIRIKDERYYETFPEEKAKWLIPNLHSSFMLNKKIYILKLARYLISDLFPEEEKKLLAICRKLNTNKIFEELVFLQHSYISKPQLLNEVIIKFNDNLPNSKQINILSFRVKLTQFLKVHKP